MSLATLAIFLVTEIFKKHSTFLQAVRMHPFHRNKGRHHKDHPGWAKEERAVRPPSQDHLGCAEVPQRLHGSKDYPRGTMVSRDFWTPSTLPFTQVLLLSAKIRLSQTYFCYISTLSLLQRLVQHFIFSKLFKQTKQVVCSVSVHDTLSELWRATSVGQWYPLRLA